MDPRALKKQEVTLAWRDLTVSVDTKTSNLLGWKKKGSEHKRVLDNVSGIAYPGTLTAIMGSSGAGKTTLMDTLAGKSEGNKVIQGQVLLNGMPYASQVGHKSAYVYQQDLFVGTLTVSEHLHFMAKMKLHRKTTKKEIRALLDRIINELGLNNCEHTRIGIPGQIQGLSGGERKRLAFASEILTDPPLLFCDEPTTGLDSFSAQNLVEMMQKLASRGKTIICTIHQPSSQVFTMFDQLLLLAEGQTAYLGKLTDAPMFFQSVNLICPDQYNPADFYARVLAVSPGKEDESRKQIGRICNSFASTPRAKQLEAEISEQFAQTSDKIVYKNVNLPPLWPTQLIWLTWRAFINSYRDPKIHVVRTIQKIIMALLLGVCYFGVTLNQMGIQDIQGAVFIFITENTFPSLYGVLFVFPKQLPLFLRENKAGLYRSDTYYISTMISLLPGFVFEPLLFSSIAYWMIGLRPTAEAFFITCMVVVLTANVSAACGCFFSAAFEDVTVAVTCLLPIDYILKITGGLFVNIGSLSPWIAWMNFVSWFMYANEVLTVTQWSNVTNISCEGAPAILCIPDGEKVIESRSFAENQMARDFTGLVTLYFGFHAAAYTAIFFRSRRNK